MSWSFSAIGTPEKIAAAIEEQSSKSTGQSKIEFDAAKPHLIGLVQNNFAKGKLAIVNISASGSGSAQTSASGEIEQTARQCSVKIERMYSDLLI